MAVLFSSYLIVFVTFWAAIFAQESPSPTLTTNDCLGSEWESYTVLRPTTLSCVKLEEKVDKLQETVNAILTLIKQIKNCTACEDSEDDEQIYYKDCQEIFTRGLYDGDGEYLIQPDASSQPFYVYCEQDADGSGVWTVIQRRLDSQVDFYLDWADYKYGFGLIGGNHWLGNQKIHEITSSDSYKLRVNLGDWEGNLVYADYDGFYIEGESDKYRLQLGSYSGTAGDSLSHQNGAQFSTRDQDNDIYSSNCAAVYEGAWWHQECFYSSLNGKYSLTPTTPYGKGLIWFHWKGYYYSLKTTTMKIKPNTS